MPKPIAKPRAKKKRQTKKKTPGAVGLAALDVTQGAPPAAVARLMATIAEDGGAVLAPYRDPLGGRWQILAALPLDKVVPIDFQRDLSEAHVKKLATVLSRIDRFLDPIIVVRAGDAYATPNGLHRMSAMKRIGAQSILAIVVAEPELAHQILALNTEKSPNLKDRSLEVIRMARALVALGDPPESQFEHEFEDPSFLTLGAAYEKRPRFAGATYHPLLKKVEGYFDDPLSESITEREQRADALVGLDDAVNAVVERMKAAGFVSPYLKSFVVARINPLRGPTARGELYDVVEKMTARARKMDISKIDAAAISRAAGAGPPPADD